MECIVYKKILDKVPLGTLIPVLFKETNPYVNV